LAGTFVTGGCACCASAGAGLACDELGFGIVGVGVVVSRDMSIAALVCAVPHRGHDKIKGEIGTPHFSQSLPTGGETRTVLPLNSVCGFDPPPNSFCQKLIRFTEVTGRAATSS
jgi:hypothetical protein